MTRFWSKQLRGLNAYKAGEQPQDKSYIKLNTNENPYPASPRVIEKIREVSAAELARYPDPESHQLRQCIADYYGIKNDNIFVGNGSDEVLAHAFMAFFRQVYPVCFPDISYSFYPVYCGYFQIEYQEIALTDSFKIDLEKFPEINGGIIFPNPNAPTGIGITLDEVRKLLKRNTNSVVIIDEAYADFGSESCISLIENHENLLVVQTTSKSRSLAGMRVGYAIGNSQLIDGLRIAKNSFNCYPIDTVAAAAAIAAFSDEEYFQRCCAKVIDTREWISTKLKALSFEVLPSQTNFLMVKHNKIKAEDLYNTLRDQGILVRYFSSPRIDEYIRVTCGTREEMEIFYQEVETIINRSE